MNHTVTGQSKIHEGGRYGIFDVDGFYKRGCIPKRACRGIFIGGNPPSKSNRPLHLHRNCLNLRILHSTDAVHRDSAELNDIVNSYVPQPNRGRTISVGGIFLGVWEPSLPKRIDPFQLCFATLAEAEASL